MKKSLAFLVMVSVLIPSCRQAFRGAGGANPPYVFKKYADGRPNASRRIPVKDRGIVLRHGDGPDSCDIYGAREAIAFEFNGVYYMHYDGAGPVGWLACLATSNDLTQWVKRGIVLRLGGAEKPDSKSASAPWVFRDGDTWHMFYMGTPNTSPPPDEGSLVSLHDAEGPFILAGGALGEAVRRRSLQTRGGDLLHHHRKPWVHREIGG